MSVLESYNQLISRGPGDRNKAGFNPQPSRTCGLIGFDEAIVTPGIVPDTWFLTVMGWAPCMNMQIRLVPLIYVHQPEYWEIEVVGCIGQICLTAMLPYHETIDISHFIGTMGIEVVGAGGSKRIQVP